jgi:GNAT superfamily N-acetyltransferase
MDYEIKPLSSEEEGLIEEKIAAYGYEAAPPEPGTPEEQRLVYKALNGEGRIAGGCILNIHGWGRAVLACLWVDEPCRGQGLGSVLIRQAQHAVKEKGCYYLCLGTMDFQARPLYEKHGFKVFTVNKNVPRGHDSWSLCKRLDAGTPDYVPENNAAEALYTIVPGNKEDADVICDGLNRYCNSILPDEHEDIELSRKLVLPDGSMAAGISAFVDGYDVGYIESVWVEEPYRRQGLGSRLLKETERTAKENGAYLLQTYACDWNADFFMKNGYAVRGTLEDYPKGHRSYELEKRI